MRVTARGTGAQRSPSRERGIGRFVPPGDDRSRERSRELLRVSLGAAFAFCGFAVWYLIGYRSELGFMLLAAPGLLALCVPFIMRATGSPPFAGNALAAICFVGIATIAVVRGGFPISTLIWTALIPMCALIVSERRWSVGVWSALCVLAVVAFYVLDRLGHMPGFVQLSAEQEATSHLLSLLGFLVFLVYAVRSPVVFQRRLEGERDALQSRLDQGHRLESLGQLAGGIAHDFGNVLVGISGAAELLRVRTSADDPRMKEIQVIRESTDRAAGLTKQLLTFARQQKSRPAILNANQSVAQIQTLLFRVMGNRVKLETELATDIGPISIDPRELDRVLLNIAINGRDAMGDAGGTLSLRTRDVEIGRDHALPPGRYVRITVEDTGCGMSQEVADRVFEPLFTTKQPGEGTGLGLSTCYGIVAHAGGEIVVESEAGVGTAFHIYLPVSGVGDAPQPAAPAPTVERNLRVLVVDDEQLVRSTVQSVLSEHGFHVMTAADGAEALELYARARGEIDLVLADIVMPSMSGPELRHRLRSGDTSPPPVLYMSGEPSEAECDGGGVLAKPFTTQQLLDEIRAALGFGGPGAPKN